MAIAELQVRQAALSVLVQHFASNQRLPSSTVKIPTAPVLDNMPLDSIACIGCSFADAGDTSIFCDLTLEFRYYSGLAAVKGAGSLKQPPVLTANVSLRLELLVSVSGGKPLMMFKDPLGFVNLGSLASASFDLSDMAPFVVVAGAIVQGDDVVSIRLASDAADVLGAPATNRLVEASDWTQFVPGSAIAQVVGASLGAAVGSVIKGDKNYGPGKAAAATYVTTPLLGIPATPPFVLGTAEVVAINACPVFNIDVSVELRVIATFVGNGPSIETTLHLSWSADSTWCQVADFFVATPAAPFVIASVSSDKASRAILGGGVDPAGFREIGRDDTSITYRQQRPLPVPAPLVVTASSFDSNGLTISGGMTYAPAGLGLQGWASSPTSGLLLDCGQRRVSVKFNPPQVGLLDHNTPGTPPRIFGDSLVVPANAWVIVTGGGNDTLETLVTFAEPSTGRLPAGTATSAFLSTDCGMRWVDLGVIPPDHAPPGTADTAAMLNKCMFRTASWKQRVLSYQWLPRPVEDTPEEAAVRQWLVGLTDMPADTRLQFVAVSAHGVERAIGETEGLTALAAHITTAKNETLEIRSNHDRNPPPQVAAQRWFSPIATLRLREPPMAVAAGAGLLGMRSHDGAISLLKIGTKGEIHVVPFASLRQLPADVAALVDELDRAVHSGRKPWNSMAQIDGRSGCVVHAGHLLIGRLGNQQNALAP